MADHAGETAVFKRRNYYSHYITLVAVGPVTRKYNMQEDNRTDGSKPGASDARDRRCRRNGLPTQPGSTRGVSHVVGVLLMVAVTVLLVTFVGVMALGFEMPGNQPPQVATEGSFGLASDGSGTPMVGLTHHSGEKVAVENVRIHITTDGGTVVKSVPTTGDLSDGTWSAGEDLAVPVETDDVCHGGEEADVRLVYHNDEGGTYTMAEKTVPLQASEFTISGGTAVPEHDYSAKVEVVYTGLTYGAGGPDITEHVEIEIDGSTVHTLSNVNDGDVESYDLAPQDAGDAISVVVEAPPQNTGAGWFGGATRRSTADHGDRVRVLRDSDPAPSVEGMDDQSDVATTLQPYMSGGQITLDDNQAIYLFEMGSSPESDSAYDLQDAVVLVSFTSEAGHPELVERDGTSRLVCPA